MYSVLTFLFDDVVMRFPKEGKGVNYSFPLPSERMIIGAFGSMVKRQVKSMGYNPEDFNSIMDYYMLKLVRVAVAGTGIKKVAFTTIGTLEFTDHSAPPLTKKTLSATEVTTADKIIVFMVFKGLEEKAKKLLSHMAKNFRLQNDELTVPTNFTLIDIEKPVKERTSSVTVNADLVGDNETNIYYDFTVAYIHRKPSKSRGKKKTPIYEFRDTITAYPLTRIMLYNDFDVVFKNTDTYVFKKIMLKKEVDALKVQLSKEFEINNNTEFIIPIGE